ncbi:MAG: hypothetical protein OEP52_09130, partial [Acidimicrobiia bacterium]|nr:hypothetical protein [Acidimicrobiia bacterium]
MSRPVAPPLDWESTEHEERAGPYTVRLVEAHKWQLVEDGHSVGVYPTRTGARNAAADKHRRRGIRRRLTRHLLVGTASLMALSLALAQRTEPNPEYPPARAQADLLDAARLAVASGELPIEEVGLEFAGLAGGSFEFLGRERLAVSGILAG